MSVLDRTLPTRLSYVYATDEAVFLRCPADYPELVPEHQVIAEGSDGSIVGSAPWVLNSAGTNFPAAGVQPNQVIHVWYEPPGGSYDNSPPLSADGAYLAVAGVATNALTLRRLGMDEGTGQPPVAASLGGIRFRILTFGPQIEIMSEELDRQFRIDEESPFWNPENIYNGTIPALRDACVLKVVLDAYTQQNRTKDSDWSAKRTQATADLADRLGRLAVRWGPLGDSQAPNKANAVRLFR